MEAYAGCDLYVLLGPRKGETEMIGKILYATDFSKHSLAALPLAMDLAKRYHAEMHVVHAVDAPYEFLMEDGYVVPLVTAYPIEVDQLKKSAEQRLGEFVRGHLAAFEGDRKSTRLNSS